MTTNTQEPALRHRLQTEHSRVLVCPIQRIVREEGRFLLMPVCNTYGWTRGFAYLNLLPLNTCLIMPVGGEGLIVKRGNGTKLGEEVILVLCKHVF